MTVDPRVRERPMAASEAMFVDPGTPMVLGHTLTGPLDTAALEHAWQVLLDRHPVLAARCLPTATGYTLRIDPDLPRPRLDTALGREEHEEAAGAPFAVGAPLVRAAILPQAAQRWDLYLTVHHAIADGTSALSLLARLWRTYADLAAGGGPGPSPSGAVLCAPVEDHFRARFTTADIEAYLLDRATRMKALDPLRLAPDGPDATGHTGAHVRRIALSPGQCTRLLALVRDHRLAPHALACGIILTALRTAADPTPGTRALTCMSAIDLRPRMSPPLPRESVVMAAAVTEAVAEVADDADPVGVGRQVWDQIRETVRTGDAGRAIAAMPQLMAEARAHPEAAAPMSVVVSNLSTRSAGLVLPAGLASTEPWGYAPAPGPVPAVYLSGHEGRTTTLTLAVPRAHYTAGRARQLAEGIERVAARLLGAR
ncbi:condensation domain-containing protein [Kitasatospora sp. NPDC101183]|uniref:phthiocerol/phthiodiolone dimycocerosyl transferase family protein n=1 Tax=Kitasatospora sp. NPDC101183 TaxID=3364100 RepID=UPI003822CB35